MNKVLKFGAYFGVAASLAGCSTSEHFMQDDVYNTRTPLMPPGTDLNDVTDYATFVAKKEQNEIPEQTAYVSPRQYNDLFYNSQYVYYGYSPYSSMTGIGYYGYNGINSPYSMYRYGYGGAFYPTVGFGGYYGNGYNPYYYGNNFYGGNAYYGYGNPYNYNGNSASNYSLITKPNTSKNLSSSHAGTAAGRMGSTTNNGVVSYQNKMIAKPNTPGYSGVGRNTTVNSSPVVSSASNGRNSGLQPRATARPVIAGRPSASSSSSTATRTSTNSNTTIQSNNANTGSGRTFTNSSTTRTSSPSVRSSGGSSGGSSTPSSSGGGARSGGRR
ncbi:MAG: hypothetical protein ACO1N0_09530 [Fluviicola sp.]